MSRKLFTAGWAEPSWNLAATTRLIVAPSADLDMATQSIFFGAVGTAGQRCTSTRRVIMHESVASKVRNKLLAAYKSPADWKSAGSKNRDGSVDRQERGRHGAAFDSAIER